MDTTQQPSPPVATATPGIFGTKIPCTVAFAVGILLFFLPFAEIKCGGTVYAKNSGFGIAMGKEWQSFANNNMFGNNNNGKEDNPAVTAKSNKQNPNIYAIAALALGVLGLLLSFANARSVAGGILVTGILAAGALIGLMLDLKKKFNSSDPGIDNKPDNNMFGLNNVKPVLDFTPWFYVAIIAFLVAAFFSYRRMGTGGKNL